MAVVLVQLKLAIQRRSLGRNGGGQRALFVAGWVLALALGLAAGAVVDQMASQRTGLGDLTLVILLTVLFVGWVVMPVVLPGIGDDTVDPEKLEQFPISARDQVVGLLLGSLLAPTALFTFLAVAGGTFASGETVSARIAVAMAAVIFTMLCVASSRAVQALLAGAMRSRRGRDLMIGFSGALGLSIYLLSRSAHNIDQILVDLENEPVEAVLSWLPPGAIGQGMIAVRDGRWGTALAHLLVALAGIAVALAAWAWVIRRRVVGPKGGAGRARKKPGTSTNLVLVPVLLESMPTSAVTAAASQQLRYLFFRQPRAVQSVVMLPIMGAVIAHQMVADAGLVGGAVVITTMCLLATSMYFFSYDDQGFTYVLSAGAPLRQVLLGKAVAALIVVLPLMAVFVVVEAVLTARWDEALAALLAGLNVALAGVGVGAMISVQAPQNQVHPGGDRLRALVGALVGSVLVLVVAGVLGLAWTLAGDSVGAPVPMLATLPVSALLGWLLLRWAGGRLAADPWRVERTLMGS